MLIIFQWNSKYSWALRWIMFFVQSFYCWWVRNWDSRGKYISWYILSMSSSFKIDLCLWSISGDVSVRPSAFGQCSKKVTSIRLAGMIRTRDSRAAGLVCLYLVSFSSIIFVVMAQDWLGKRLCFSLAHFPASEFLLIRNCQQRLNWPLQKLSSSSCQFKQYISLLSHILLRFQSKQNSL